MELTNEFEVAVPVEEAWAVLTDIERIAPCMPGAELKEVEGDEYRGLVKVKVGPITASYRGAARFEEKDAEAHRAVLKADGRETRGQGNASATITASLFPSGAGTKVTVVTDMAITGKVAQFGRGVLADVSGKLLDQFVHNLESTVLTPGGGDPPAGGATTGSENGGQTDAAEAPGPSAEPPGASAESVPTGGAHGAAADESPNDGEPAGATSASAPAAPGGTGVAEDTPGAKRRRRHRRGTAAQGGTMPGTTAGDAAGGPVPEAGGAGETAPDRAETPSPAAATAGVATDGAPHTAVAPTQPEAATPAPVAATPAPAVATPQPAAEHSGPADEVRRSDGIRQIHSTPAEPVDLVSVAGSSVAKRLVPFASIAGALVLLRIVLYAMKRRKP